MFLQIKHFRHLKNINFIKKFNKCILVSLVEELRNIKIILKNKIKVMKRHQKHHSV